MVHLNEEEAPRAVIHHSSNNTTSAPPRPVAVDDTHGGGKRFRWWEYAVISTMLLVILAVGLGLGLYRRSNSSSNTTTIVDTPQNNNTNNTNTEPPIPETSITRKWLETSWLLLGQDADDFFGTSVSVSRDAIAIGASQRQQPQEQPGYVRILSFSNSSVELQPLGEDLQGQSPGDEFGRHVALEGPFLAIAAKTYVQVYKWNSTTWNQLGDDLSGSVVALSSTEDGLVVVVATAVDTLVQVWRHDGINQTEPWNMVGSNVTEGTVLALSCHNGGPWLLAVGEPTAERHQGQVSLFQLDDTAWTLVLQVAGDSPGDEFGDSLALTDDGTCMVVGAPRARLEDFQTLPPGYARVYCQSNGTWTMVSDLMGVARRDYFGTSVDVASVAHDDGTTAWTVAVGATESDQGDINAGAVFVFRSTSSSSLPNQPFIREDTLLGVDMDELGNVVSMSSDARVLAAGAVGDSVNGAFSGQVRIFLQAICSVDQDGVETNCTLVAS